MAQSAGFESRLVDGSITTESPASGMPVQLMEESAPWSSPTLAGGWSGSSTGRALPDPGRTGHGGGCGFESRPDTDRAPGRRGPLPLQYHRRKDLGVRPGTGLQNRRLQGSPGAEWISTHPSCGKSWSRTGSSIGRAPSQRRLGVAEMRVRVPPGSRIEPRGAGGHYNCHDTGARTWTYGQERPKQLACPEKY